MTARDRIASAIVAVSEVKKAADQVIKHEQDTCPHKVILERPSGVTGYRYIENSWFPAVRVCADCGLTEEKERMTPLYNTYRNEKKPRLTRFDYKIDESKLNEISIGLFA